MQTVKLIDLQDEIIGRRNLQKNHVRRILIAFCVALKKYLLKNKKLNFINFVRMGAKTVKDRVVRSDITHEMLHVPQHLRFKAEFSPKFKKFINEKNPN